MYNPLPSASLITALLLATLIVLFFIHANYKKYMLFSTLNEFLMFIKMIINKKMTNCAGKKIIISYLFITSVGFIYVIVISVYARFWWGGMKGGLYSYDENQSLDLDIQEIFIGVFMALIFVLIIRLIYEFIVIPIAVSNRQTQVYQQNVSMQQINQQPVQPTNINGLNNVPTIQTGQQFGQAPIAPESQFKFCSQCGTRYDVAEDKCPNCGMK